LRLAVQRYRSYCLFGHFGQHRLLWMLTCGTAIQELWSFCPFGTASASLDAHLRYSGTGIIVLLSISGAASACFCFACLYCILGVNVNWSLLKTFHVKYPRPCVLHPGIDGKCEDQTESLSRMENDWKQGCWRNDREIAVMS
jgi:hypothetical protein